MIKKLRKLSPMLQKREQAPKCGSNEEGKKLFYSGHAVAYLVEALHYKPDDRGFNFR
jgi:hypothetical protein